MIPIHHKAALAVLLAGFAAPGGCTAPNRTGRESWPVAIRYDVEPRFVGRSPEAAIEAISGDFATIADLGFDRVVLRQVDDIDRGAVLTAAAAAGLKAAIPDSHVQHYLRTGVLPPGVRSPSALLRSIPRPLLGHPAIWAVEIRVGNHPEAWRRFGELTAAGGTRNTPLILLGDSPAREGRGGLTPSSFATISADVNALTPNQSLTEHWLRQLHAGFIAGRTAGLVIDRFRSLPGEVDGLIPPGQTLGVTARTAIEETAIRAGRWGPLLHGRNVESLVLDQPDEEALKSAVFTGGKRRYVLVFNASPDRYFRGEIALPVRLGNQPATRVVEIPSSRDRTAGRVFPAMGGVIPVSAQLRPGNAVLLEIF